MLAIVDIVAGEGGKGARQYRPVTSRMTDDDAERRRAARDGARRSRRTRRRRRDRPRRPDRRPRRSATCAELGGPDAAQVLAYDIAHAAAGVATARALLDYGAKGDLEARITCAYAADMLHDLSSKIFGREDDWGVERDPLAAVQPFVRQFRDPDFLGALADQPGPRHLDTEMDMVADSFRAFANDVHRPARRARAPDQRRRARGDRDGPRRTRARSGSACRRSTAASAKEAAPSTRRWSSPPRSSRGPASASADR